MIEKISNKFNEYLHLVDIKQFGKEYVTSAFIAEFDDCVVVIDPGSSLDIRKLLRYMKRNNILLNSVKYIISSHCHFDHNGGLWKLYDEVKEHNPNVKIISSFETMKMLNNFKYEPHFTRSRKSFGPLMGELRMIEESAFKVLRSEDYFDIDDSCLRIIDTFELNYSKVELAIIKTPGHSPGHICPLFIKDGVVDFIYVGEAAGAFLHSTSLITVPSSAAPDFNYETYMDSLKKLKKLNSFSVGFCHYGAVTSFDDVQEILNDNESFTKLARELVVKYYNENPTTKYVVDKLLTQFHDRSDYSEDKRINSNVAFTKLGLTLVYGIMMDLGYRD